MDAAKLKKIMVQCNGYKPVKDGSLISTEENIISTIFKLLRVPEVDGPITINLHNFHEKNTETDESEELDSNFEYIEELNKMLKNYDLNKFIVYVLEEAHNNWIVENVDRLNYKKIRDAYKFVPLDLLEWKDANKYFTVAQPILSSLNIEFDKDKVKDQFMRNKIALLLGNGIYSKEILEDCIKNTDKFYIDLLMVKNGDGIKAIEKLRSENVVKQIVNQLDEKTDLNLANQLKKALEIDRDNIGGICSQRASYRKGKFNYEENLGQKKFGIRRMAYPQIKAPISQTLLEISKEGVIFVQNPKKYSYNYTDMSNKNFCYPDNVLFLPYNECKEDQKKLIEKRKKKLDKLTSNIQDNSSKYREPGLITFVLLDVAKRAGKSSSNKPAIIQIGMTREEIIKMGYLPEELGWESKKRGLINSDRSVLISSNEKANLNKDNQTNESKIDSFHQRIKLDGHQYMKDKVEQHINNIKSKEKNEKER